MNTIDLFKTMVVMMLFYSFAITLLTNSLAPHNILYIDEFGLSNNYGFNNTANQIQDSLETQTNIPVVEVGALVFYSGNILLDLLLNFIFAIPQMLGMVVHGILQILNIDSGIWATVELFSSVCFIALYSIGLIQLITGIRSGRIV